MKTTVKTLIEQMGFSEREIARRLHFINFTSVDAERVQIVQEHIEKTLPSLIEEYYDYQLSDPDIAAIISDAGTLARLKGYMATYVTTLFSGDYDEAYVNSRLRIGKIHKRLEVVPKLYMKAQAKLQSLLDREVEACSFVEDAELIKKSLHKIMLFDTELVFDAYVEAYLTEMQSAAQEVEKYASQVGIQADTLFSRFQEKAQKDSLTGLYNRRSLYDFLKRECLVAERHHLSFVLVYLDLNGFKPINDLHGHHAGDLVLEQVANSLQSETRTVDIPARYGGDEFCIVMPRTSLDDVLAPLQRLMDDFDANCPYPVTFSIGALQVGPAKFEEPEELLKKADKLMYQAKEKAHQDGKHHWQFDAVKS